MDYLLQRSHKLWFSFVISGFKPYQYQYCIILYWLLTGCLWLMYNIIFFLILLAQNVFILTMTSHNSYGSCLLCNFLIFLKIITIHLNTSQPYILMTTEHIVLIHCVCNVLHGVVLFNAKIKKLLTLNHDQWLWLFLPSSVIAHGPLETMSSSQEDFYLRQQWPLLIFSRKLTASIGIIDLYIPYVVLAMQMY